MFILHNLLSRKFCTVDIIISRKSVYDGHKANTITPDNGKKVEHFFCKMLSFKNLHINN